MFAVFSMSGDLYFVLNGFENPAGKVEIGCHESSQSFVMLAPNVHSE